MVDKNHAELRLEHHGFREHLDKLIEDIFAIWLSRVVYEDDSVSVLLHRGPAFFVLEVSTNVPELNVKLADVRNSWGRIPLKINNSKWNLSLFILNSQSYLHPMVGL